MKCKLGDICLKIGSGATPRGGKEAYCTEGISLIRSQNVLDFSFSMGGLAYINDIQARQLDGVTVNSNDVLLNITGDSVARACIVPTNILPARVNQHVAIIRPDDKKADGKYILYFLQSIKPLLLQISSSGGTRNALTKSMIEALEINLPSISEQKAVADTLSCLDDKIELNNSMNRTLEEMAQAIFKSWFVDFEPFQDGEFVDSELGPIPKGWRVGTLGEIAEISTKSINPSKTPETLFEHYSIPSYDEASFPVFEKGNNIKSNKYLIPCDAWLISKLNPTTKRVWQPFMLSKNAICSTEFIVYSASKLRYRDFCFESTNSANFFDFLCSNTSGSTNSRQRAIPKETLKYQLVIPTENIMKAFSQLVDPIYEEMKNNLVECQRLISLRNSLLPKLMNGEIRVPIEVK